MNDAILGIFKKVVYQVFISIWSENVYPQLKVMVKKTATDIDDQALEVVNSLVVTLLAKLK